MPIEPDADTNKQDSDSKPEKSLTDKSAVNASEHHHLSAHKGYETAKRLTKRLRQTAKKLTIAEWLTVVFTGTIAIATVWNVVVLSGQLNEMHGEQRAWIAPTEMALTKEPKQGDPITIALSYDNVGITPATDVREHFNLLAPLISAMSDGSAMSMVENNSTCNGIDPMRDADVIYPRAGGVKINLSVRQTDADGQPIEIYAAFMKGGRSLVVQFCIAYRTMSEIHKSEFCYFYWPGFTEGLNMDRCSKGNKVY